MSKAIYYSGMEDLEGQLIGTLRIGSIASRSPIVRWHVCCQGCGSHNTESHARLTSGAAKCRNNACGKDNLREAASETLASYWRRTDASASAKANAEAERRAAQTRRLERELAVTHGKVRAAIRERILSGKDDEIFITPELRTKVMTQEQADAYNKQQADEFVRSTPEWNERFASPENLDILGSYFDRNGLAIVDNSMIRAAFERLRDCGALIERETAAPVPEPQVAIVEPEPELKKKPTPPRDGLEGWDWLTGEPRFFTTREINRMTGDEYKRSFKITRDKQILGRRPW